VTPGRPLVVGGLAIALSCGAALTGCSTQEALANAQKACARVEIAIRDERAAQSATATRASSLRETALVEIRAALPFAAIAAGEDTSWQALEATLSESNRIPVSFLVHALSLQCQAPLAG
jgi:hypothetical protein